MRSKTVYQINIHAPWGHYETLEVLLDYRLRGKRVPVLGCHPAKAGIHIGYVTRYGTWGAMLCHGRKQ